MGKKTKLLRLIFAFFFYFSPFSISHSNVIHWEICVKDFSGTTAPRILKFGTNVGYDLLHCVRANQPPDAYHFLYLSSFLSLQSNLLLHISQLLWEPEFSIFFIHLKSGQAKYIVGQKTKMLRFIFTIFLHFSISHSNVIHREIFVKDFSGTTAPRKLKFGTNVGFDLLYCVKENQHAAAYHFLYLSIFLSLYTLRGAKFIVRRKPRFCD